MTQQEIKYNQLKRIVTKKQFDEVEGYMIDLYSASLMVNIADRLNCKNRAKFLSQPIDKMVDIAFSLCNKKPMNDV